MPTYTYFDSPAHYQNLAYFNDVGSSPYLLERLIHHLDEQTQNLSVIYIAFYLFNNKILHDKLAELASSGVEIQVITIPIDGYDSTNAQEIKIFTTQRPLGKATKYALAKEVFKEYYRNEIPGATLSFFPHKYIRSSKLTKFSRGELPYSMHIKAVLALNKDGSGFVGFSSSNFAVRDLIKEEYLVIVNNNPALLATCRQFFKELSAASIPITKFDFGGNYNKYPVVSATYPTNDVVGFTAPFYPNSNRDAERELAAFILQAKTSIKIAAQHVCPVNKNGDIILKALLQQANDGIKVEVISQTFATGDPEFDKYFHTPANTKAFIEFYRQIRNIPNITYAVNDRLHSKYIIADERVLISSFNYTPTQFTYIDNVAINNGDLQYEGIFSECGIYTIIDEVASIKAFKANFEHLLARENTIKVQ
nr:phospholipase D-like domain-containing protein [uncultured Mucilaginibacter sp.]